MPLHEPVEVVAPEDLGPVHFIGIGGVSMRGIANLFVGRGVRVAGSDRDDSAGLAALREAGVTTHIGQRAGQLGDAQTVVVTTAINEANPELAEARARGLRVLHRSAALASLMVGRRGIGISGSHGKSTTSGMVVTALRSLDPSYQIGAALTGGPATGAHAGAGEWFVIEADESDGSYRQYDCEIVVVTNIEADHLDNWGTPERYEAGYREFAGKDTVRVAVINADDAPARALAAELRERGTRVVTYGEADDADARLTISDDRGRLTAEIAYGGARGELAVGLPGRHNLSNAAAAYVVARLAGVEDAEARAALAGFGGTARRFQAVGEAGGVRVVDDYAHHPTEVAALLKAARASVGDGRLVVAFQPHLFTRTRDFATEFGRALAAADELVVLDVYPAREEPIPGVTGQLVADAAAAAGASVTYCADLAQAPAVIAGIARPGDLVLTVGAGSITTVGPRLVELLRERGS